MSTYTTRPNATNLNGDSTVTGAGSRHAALNDDSDSSYVNVGTPGDDACEIGFAEPSIPGDAVLKEIRLRTRARKTALGQHTIRYTLTVDGNFNTGKSVSIVHTNSTAQTITVLNDPLTFSETVSDLQVRMRGIGGNGRVFELYADTIAVAIPVVTVTYPAGTITDTNVPAIVIEPLTDNDGGVLTHYQAKVFTSASDPDADDAEFETGVQEFTGATAPTVPLPALDEPFPNDHHWLYVRVAQTLNGSKHWSEWAVSDFEIDTAEPLVLDVTVTPQPSEGRFQFQVNVSASDGTFEIERSTGPGEWVGVRESDGGDGPDSIVYDFEAPIGVEVTYRVRALIEGVLTDWATFGPATLDSSEWWIKHPFLPFSLNLVLPLIEFGSIERPARQGVHAYPGRVHPTVSSEVRGSERGELTAHLRSRADREALNALIDSATPLLLQGPYSHGEPDRWVVIGDTGRVRIVDKSWCEVTVEGLPWQQVARPAGSLVGAP